jgi:hypothetical protein
MGHSDHLRRIRQWVALFIVGLVLSGITAFPLESELRWFDAILQTTPLRPLAGSTHLLPWIARVHQALADTNSHYPFLAYGTDWLAFAHLVIAVAFIGPYIDPVLQKYSIEATSLTHGKG